MKIQKIKLSHLLEKLKNVFKRKKNKQQFFFIKNKVSKLFNNDVIYDNFCKNDFLSNMTIEKTSSLKAKMFYTENY